MSSAAWFICWERQDPARARAVLHHRIVETRDTYLACLGECFDAGDTIMGVSPNAEIMPIVLQEWARAMLLWRRVADPYDSISVEMLPKSDKEWAWTADVAKPSLISDPEGKALYQKTAAATYLTEKELEKIQKMQDVATKIWLGHGTAAEKMRKFQNELGFLPDEQDRMAFAVVGINQTGISVEKQCEGIDLGASFRDVIPKLDKVIDSLDKILEAAPCTV